MQDATLFTNARIVDGRADRPLDPCSVLVADGRVREVGAAVSAPADARVVDLSGKTLLPGLIDAHVHVIATTPDLGANAELPNALVALEAARIMRGMLMRGFTTVRDLGGADVGLVLAVERGLVEGPRLNICGKALSQTGGHTDYRGRFDRRPADHYADRLGSLGRIVDGVAEMRRACREEIKGGADYIKLMANGGVSSPTDPIAFFGFSAEEIAAAVEEAEAAQTYVAGHLYTDVAIRRAVELGVRSVEHANLIEPATARLVAEKGAIVVPTLITYTALKEDGPGLGLPQESIDKIDDVRLRGLESLSILREAGVEMAFGTDLLGAMHRRQSEEFTIRGQVLPAEEVIGAATHVAAKLLKMEGEIGAVAPGAHADLVVVDGDPLSDLALLGGQGDRLPAIMARGRFVKDALAR